MEVVFCGEMFTVRWFAYIYFRMNINISQLQNYKQISKKGRLYQSLAIVIGDGFSGACTILVTMEA